MHQELQSVLCQLYLKNKQTHRKRDQICVTRSKGSGKRELDENNKIIYRNFSGAVVGRVGSVQCQIVPYSCLYLFSRSMLLSHFSRVQLCVPP